MNNILNQLEKKDAQEIKKLFPQIADYHARVDDIWIMMDTVWDNLGCDNKKTNPDSIQKFYSHPIWTLNGLFVEQDIESIKNRESVADWIAKHNIKEVLDYGGGFGTLARIIADRVDNINIYIYEPYPSKLATEKNNAYKTIQICKTLEQKKYECSIAMDVLEHVPDPLKTFSEIIDATQLDGYVILGNHFYPSIKCHLPSTFHLRYTFRVFAYLMGLNSKGKCARKNSNIYQKVRNKKQNWLIIRFLEPVSRFIFPLFSLLQMMFRAIKRFFS